MVARRSVSIPWFVTECRLGWEPMSRRTKFAPLLQMTYMWCAFHFDNKYYLAGLFATSQRFCELSFAQHQNDKFCCRQKWKQEESRNFILDRNCVQSIIGRKFQISFVHAILTFSTCTHIFFHNRSVHNLKQWSYTDKHIDPPMYLKKIEKGRCSRPKRSRFTPRCQPADAEQKKTTCRGDTMIRMQVPTMACRKQSFTTWNIMFTRIGIQQWREISAWERNNPLFQLIYPRVMIKPPWKCHRLGIFIFLYLMFN